MPQCVKCKEFFSMSYCVEALPNDPNDDASICVFCKLNLKEVTIQYEDGDEKVTRDDAIRLYREYISKLTRNRKIKHIIDNGKQSKIIMPGDKDW